MARKAFLGPKIRRLRRDRGLTQAQMAERLGISPSYLNLIENNQRSLTVELLLRIGQVFDVDLAGFAEDETAELVSGLREVFAEPVLESAGVTRQDMLDLAEAAPAAARAVIALHRAWREVSDAAATSAERAVLSGDAAAADRLPGRAAGAFEEVGEFFQDRGNHFPELEAAADEIWAEGGIAADDIATNGVAGGLAGYLERQLGIRVRVMPVDVMAGLRRRYDRHSGRLLLSEMLPDTSRLFEMAVTVAHQRSGAVVARIAGEANLSSAEAGDLARLGLANYLAGAIVMPYDRFFRAATQLRYDIQVLQGRFGASFEQVCHRLTTLQRPGARGVPFFMMRVDKAGNVSKRFSASRLAFARYGGSCPRWNVHDAFRAPDRLHVQVSEMIDGARYLSVARAVRKPGRGFHAPGTVHAVALGCEIAHAPQIVYGDGLDLSGSAVAVPIGLTCRLCERLDCAERAAPPVGHRVTVDPYQKGPVSYRMEPV